MSYRVVITPAAQRQLDRQRGTALVGVRGVILGLADEPRPRGAAKLASSLNLWRLRVRIDGRAWRVVYQVDDTERQVTVTRVVPRDEGTYRRL